MTPEFWRRPWTVPELVALLVMGAVFGFAILYIERLYTSHDHLVYCWQQPLPAVCDDGIKRVPPASDDRK